MDGLPRTAEPVGNGQVWWRAALTKPRHPALAPDDWVREPGSYPIVETTYQIVCSKYPDAKTGQAVRAFLQAAIGPGQYGLADIGFVSVPAAFPARLATAVNAIA